MKCFVDTGPGPFETFYAGKRPRRIHIYDKVAQATKKGDLDFWLSLWGLSGNQECLNIWRVEFQLARNALTKLGIDRIEDLMAGINTLWATLVGKGRKGGCFSLRLPYGNEQLSRRLLAPVWQVVQAQTNLFASSGAASQIVRQPVDLDITVRQILGLMRKYGSQRGVTDPHTLWQLLRSHQRHLVPDETLRSEIEAKMLHEPRSLSQHPQAVGPQATLAGPAEPRPSQVPDAQPSLGPED
jgi:hypothetical protein